MNTCENCKWFAARQHSNYGAVMTKYECRIRSTPTTFPERQLDDWCGEHIKKPYIS